MHALPNVEFEVGAESKLTSRSQTTIPTSVRKALKLKPGHDSITYKILSSGDVLISRKNSEEEKDLVMESFLNFLAKDIKKHPEQVQQLDEQLINRAISLTAGIDIDLNNPLSDDDE
ncbi:type II toxin-antitoxin system PrlF family antitoxin [Photorhabdus luminescens]|uniref:Type II toxin-antitoxin system PrlF family antitoxin n=1 Tax=Photorhabdus luminescens subsp. sonorensis TaxID=1173677 RepID=A0A5C4RHX4_PHOLU|nr:type II toxin-antitoxin system PrlF family antitoxin [Photorhabdus luminescens]TNH43640.1 type II toxin-antitoxin system PrlF family antitoxin [Photorhabdus luminescens subsp. sonorensis]